MNTINIRVQIKDQRDAIQLVLFQKIYSTPYGIVNQWSTGRGSEYRLEVIVDEDDLTVSPLKVAKSLEIISDEQTIANQMILELYEKESFQVYKLKNAYL